MSALPQLHRSLSARLRHLQLDALTVLPLLTVVILLLRAPSIWYLQIPLTITCVVGLAYQRLLRSAPFWYVTTTLVGTTLYFNWETADNHKYLIAYWCLTLCCVFSLPRRQQNSALLVSSRWLIGLCMAWAVFWKLVSPDYLDGSFFHHTLLVDERFDHFTRLIAGVSARALADNRSLHDLLLTGHLRGIPVEAVTLSDTWRVHRVAQVLTWWTILIEAVIAVVFLVPERWWRKLAKFRNPTLLIFAITTYAVAPVIGFGWMLMLLGIAQCRRAQHGWKVAFLATFLLIQAYAFPVGDLLQVIGRWLATGGSGCGL